MQNLGATLARGPVKNAQEDIIPESLKSLLDQIDYNELDSLGEENKYQIGVSSDTADAREIIDKLKEAIFHKDLANGREKVFIPAFSSMLKKLADPKVSKSEKQNQLFIMAESLGNCNTPIVDLCIRENLVMLSAYEKAVEEKVLPQHQIDAMKPKLSKEELTVILEKITLESLLKSKLQKAQKENPDQRIALDKSEPIENMAALFNALYQGEESLIDLTGGPEFPIKLTANITLANYYVSDAQKEIFKDFVCRRDENGEFMERDGKLVIDRAKIEMLTFDAREANNLLYPTETFKTSYQDLLMESDLLLVMSNPDFPQELMPDNMDKIFRDAVSDQGLSTHEVGEYTPIFLDYCKELMQHHEVKLGVASQEVSMSRPLNSDAPKLPKLHNKQADQKQAFQRNFQKQRKSKRGMSV